MKTTNNNTNIKENKRKWNARRIFDPEVIGIRITISEKIARGRTNQLYSDLEALPFPVDHFLKHVLIES
tara:strand:+ start:1092 stop:1298 length:207 start_codon:yes stop_codon:yes gene_type:complete